MSRITIFSWGYWGWGNATPQLVHLVDSVEAARGFNPPPANFSDPTTIAMLQESYLFWRIKKGGVGLPIEGMPWKSAMPRWEVELPDEWIWKIIMGEYDGAHQSPRTWE